MVLLRWLMRILIGNHPAGGGGGAPRVDELHGDGGRRPVPVPVRTSKFCWARDWAQGVEGVLCVDQLIRSTSIFIIREPGTTYHHPARILYPSPPEPGLHKATYF